ncbi:carboxypeptidase regulatory-like domain-containing protein [Candidatus Micrarchaeota archaeon]|nr:carboxypeptidase regulatory-like domain-containing protein [Candidatus Micrarchaeota archaeon]
MRLLFIALFLFAISSIISAPLSDSCPSNRPYCLTSSEAVSQGCTGGSPQCEYSPQYYPQYCYSCPATSEISINARTECPNTWVIKITDASTGAPISGASVIATGPGPSLYGTTNSNGEVSFTGATPGNYYVSVSPPNPYKYKSTSLTYSECSKDIYVDTQLQCDDNVKVTVKSAADNQPLANALVYLYNSNNELISSDTTDSYGEAFVGPANDKQTFYVEVIPASPYNKKKEQKTFSYSAECLIDTHVYPSCDRSVSIVVVNNKTLQPIANAEVTLTRTDRFVIGKKLTSDEDGQVVYNNVDAGTYSIAVYHPYVGQKTRSEKISFEDCGAGVLTVEYTCKKLLVQFKNTDGTPIAGGTVTVYKSGDTAFAGPLGSAQTDERGVAVIEIEKGSYTVVASYDSVAYASTSFTADKDSCEDIKVDHVFVCPDLLLIKLTDSAGNSLEGVSISLVGSNRPSDFKSTDANGIASFDTVPSGSYTVSGSSGSASISKTIEVDKSQCVGCSNDNICKTDESCNTSEYQCEKVEGECGYAKEHQWVNYECCKDSDCKTGYKCDNNVCKEKKYDIVVPSQTNVSDNVPVKAYEDGKPCANCEITIEDPSGNKTRITTNENGEATFFTPHRGNYKLNLLSGSSVVASKTSTASVEIGSEDPLKKLIALLSDEKIRNWLIVIVIVIIGALLYLHYRGKSGEKVKPETPEQTSP